VIIKNNGGSMPPTELTEKAETVSETASSKVAGKKPRGNDKSEQGQLPLELEQPRGQFTQVEPTVFNGEDLDVPTYLRRGMKV
jgi:cell division protein FtsZ